MNWKLLKRYFIIAVKKDMEFKIDYVYVLLFLLPSLIVFPAFWFFASSKTAMPGWDWTELALLSMVSFLGVTFSGLVGMWNANQMESIGPHYITKHLKEPVNPLLALYLSGIFSTELLSLSCQALAIILFIIYFHVQISPLFFALYALISALLVFEFLFLPVVLSLYIGKASRSVENLVWGMFRIGRMPIDKSGQFFGFLFSFVIPLVFIGVYPAKSIVYGNIGSLFLAIGILAGFFALEYIIWNEGLKRFEAWGE